MQKKSEGFWGRSGFFQLKPIINLKTEANIWDYIVNPKNPKKNPLAMTSHAPRERNHYVSNIQPPLLRH
jgi:hypothetical protein